MSDDEVEFPEQRYRIQGLVYQVDGVYDEEDVKVSPPVVEIGHGKKVEEHDQEADNSGRQGKQGGVDNPSTNIEDLPEGLFLAVSEGLVSLEGEVVLDLLHFVECALNNLVLFVLRFFLRVLGPVLPGPWLLIVVPIPLFPVEEIVNLILVAPPVVIHIVVVWSLWSGWWRDVVRRVPWVGWVLDVQRSVVEVILSLLLGSLARGVLVHE